MILNLSPQCERREPQLMNVVCCGCGRGTAHGPLRHIFTLLAPSIGQGNRLDVFEVPYSPQILEEIARERVASSSKLSPPAPLSLLRRSALTSVI